MSVRKINKYEMQTVNSKEFKKSHSALRLTSFLPGAQSQLLLMYLEAVHRSEFTQFRHAFTADSVSQLFQIDRSQIAGRLKPSINKMKEVKVDIAQYMDDSDEGDYLYRSLFEEIGFRKGEFIFQIDEKVVPVVKDALKSFALVDNEIFLLRSSDYGVNLYQYLSRFKTPKTSWYTQDIDELMYVFGIKDAKGKTRPGKASYESPSRFVKYVLMRAINDLDESKDIKKLKFRRHKCQYTGKDLLGIEVIRKRNAVNSPITGIRFHYEWEQDKSEPVHETPDMIIDRLRKKGQKLSKKGKLLSLPDLEKLYQAFSDKNDVENMERTEQKISERVQEQDDSDLDELFSYM